MEVFWLGEGTCGDGVLGEANFSGPALFYISEAGAGYRQRFPESICCRFTRSRYCSMTDFDFGHTVSRWEAVCHGMTQV